MHPGEDPADGSQIIYGWRSLLIYSLLSLLTVPPVFFFLNGSVRSACRMIERKTAKRGCICFTGALLLFCAAIYGLMEAKTSELEKDLRFLTAVTGRSVPA